MGALSHMSENFRSQPGLAPCSEMQMIVGGRDLYRAVVLDEM